jgi:hypothetical protein
MQNFEIRSGSGPVDQLRDSKLDNPDSRSRNVRHLKISESLKVCMIYYASDPSCRDS